MQKVYGCTLTQHGARQVSFLSWRCLRVYNWMLSVQVNIFRPLLVCEYHEAITYFIIDVSQYVPQPTSITGAFSVERNALMSGIEEADSVAWDAHKV